MCEMCDPIVWLNAIYVYGVSYAAERFMSLRYLRILGVFAYPRHIMCVGVRVWGA